MTTRESFNKNLLWISTLCYEAYSTNYVLHPQTGLGLILIIIETLMLDTNGLAVSLTPSLIYPNL